MKILSLLLSTVVSASAATVNISSNPAGTFTRIEATSQWDDASGRLVRGYVDLKIYGIKDGKAWGNTWNTGSVWQNYNFALELNPVQLGSTPFITPSESDIASLYVSVNRIGYEETKIVGNSALGSVGFSRNGSNYTSFIFRDNQYKEFVIDNSLSVKITGILGNYVVGSYWDIATIQYGSNVMLGFVSVIPEPSSLSLLALGGVLVALRRRR